MLEPYQTLPSQIRRGEDLKFRNVFLPKEARSPTPHSDHSNAFLVRLIIHFGFIKKIHSLCTTKPNGSIIPTPYSTMKLTCLSLLLLATSAAAYRPSVGGEEGNRRGLKTGEKEMGMEKGAQGKKGSMEKVAKGKKGSMKKVANGMKGKKAMKEKGMKEKGMKQEKVMKEKGMKEKKAMKEKGMQPEKAACQTVRIKADYSEIEASLGQTAVGETFNFPVYDYDTDLLIGSYTDQTTQIFVGGEAVDCVFTGSFNFDFDENLDFPFVSQVTVAGTCLGASNAITGGTGKYSGAAGSEVFIDVGADYFASELVICNTCANTCA
jgi:hypothetical protein